MIDTARYGLRFGVSVTALARFESSLWSAFILLIIGLDGPREYYTSRRLLKQFLYKDCPSALLSRIRSIRYCSSANRVIT